jgi:hypothetical protein
MFICLYAVKETLRTLALLPLLDLPTFEPSPNAHTRIEVSRLAIREVGTQLHSCVLRLRVLTDGCAQA